MDFERLAADLTAQARDLLPQWFPAGKWAGREFQVGNLRGDEGSSLSINGNSGAWSDFASGEKGGDLISLYAAMRGLTQLDAAKQLANGHDYGGNGAAPPKPRKRAPARNVTLPPRPIDSMRHPQYGEPSRTWTYLNAEGALLGYVARYDPEGQRKQIVPWTYGERSHGAGLGWGMGQWPEPRPLYGLDLLALAPDAAVMLVEGEKDADAARVLNGPDRYIVVTWPGGSQAWRKVDWAPLKGRKLLLWPDADKKRWTDKDAPSPDAVGELKPETEQPGYSAMLEIAAHLAPSAREIKILQVDGAGGDMDGWGAADAVAEGMDWEGFKAWARPRAKLLADLQDDIAAVTAPKALRMPPPAAQESPQRAEEPPPISEAPPAPEEAPEATAKPEKHRILGAAGSKGQTWGPLFPWEGTPWAPLMICTDKGQPKPILANCITALRLDPAWQEVLTYDQFAMQTYATKVPPFATGEVGQWKDVYDAKTAEWLQRVGLMVNRGTAADAIECVAQENGFHPVRDYLIACRDRWDGTQRLEHWLIDFVGTKDAPYTREIGRVFMIGAVARIMRPGCKVDTALILEGPQGKRKSMVFDVLGGAWFSDDVSELGGKDSKMEVAGAWIIELAELSQMNRGDLETTKAFLTRRIDRFRPPYGKRVIERPRQCVFGGTSNNNDYLKDDENRRFLPVRVGDYINIEGLRDVRDQLWGEALARFEGGEEWWIQDPELLDVARQQQNYRRQADSWENKVVLWLEDQAAAPRASVRMEEFLKEAIGLSADRHGILEQTRMGRILARLGWTVHQRRVGSGRVREYRPPDAQDDPISGE